MFTIKTQHLLLRPFQRSDALGSLPVSPATGRVASMTSDIPYPFDRSPGAGLAQTVPGARCGLPSKRTDSA